MTLANRNHDNIFMRQRSAGKLHAFLFFAFVVIGSVAIIFFRQRGYSFYFVTGVPVGLLVLYLMVSLAWRRFRLVDDQLGDNIYYLGLLFTLVSLSYALYEFTGNESGTEAIISNFGVALATTIVGLGLRVAVTQLRLDPIETELMARNELADASSRLKSELDGAVRDMNSFRRATEQAIAEGVENAASRATETLISFGNTFKEMAESGKNEFENSLTIFQENTRRMSEGSTATILAFESLVERIEAIEAPSDLLDEKLSSAVGAISELALYVETNSNAEQARIEKITLALEQTLEASDVAANRMGVLDDQFDELQSMLKNVRQAAFEISTFAQTASDLKEAMSDGADAQIKRLALLAEESAEFVKSIRKHNEELFAELERSRNIVGEVQGSLASMARTIADEL
jgi:hypothetical protein